MFCQSVTQKFWEGNVLKAKYKHVIAKPVHEGLWGAVNPLVGSKRKAPGGVQRCSLRKSCYLQAFFLFVYLFFIKVDQIIRINVQ